MWWLAQSEVPSWFNTISDTGIVVLLLIILYTGIRKMWVFGWMYSEKSEEANRWRDQALQGIRIASTTVEKAVEKEKD